MRVSAKTDYAIRAALELAAAEDAKPVKGERIATAQAIPLRFLENILMQLRHAGLGDSRRGAEGGGGRREGRGLVLEKRDQRGYLQ